MIVLLMNSILSTSATSVLPEESVLRTPDLECSGTQNTLVRPQWPNEGVLPVRLQREWSWSFRQLQPDWQPCMIMKEM